MASKLRRPSENWVFHSWSGFAEKSLKRAKKLGAITIVERSCPHIDFQTGIVEEEKEKLLNRKIQESKRCRICEKMKREYEIADYIFVPSQYTARTFFKRGFSPEKIKIIPLSNEKRTKCENFREKNLEGKFVVLSIGGNFYRKGLFYLAKAWQELKLEDAKLIVKASIPEKFKKVFQGDNIELIERHLSDDEIFNLYKKASIFVLPSIDDGFGMVVTEAMASGLPVIVTENVGASDIIEEGKEGFIVPIRNVEALKEKILFFYENREQIKRMGEMAFKKAKEYTPEKYVKRVLDNYQEILKNR